MRGRRWRIKSPLRSMISHTILLGFGLMTLAPFAWMMLASFKSLADVESLRPLPQQGWHPKNYAIVLRLKADPITNAYIPIHYGRYYFNSVFVASWVTFL